jgi:hypothetical protein
MQFFIVLCKNKEYDAHYILNFENLNNYPMELKTVSWQFYSYQNPFKKHIKEHRIYFVEQLVHRKIEQKVQKFHGYPLPPTCTASSIINTPHQSGVLVTLDESALTQLYHSGPQWTLQSTLDIEH